MSLDKRPKSLEVRGFQLEDLDEVKAHFAVGAASLVCNLCMFLFCEKGHGIERGIVYILLFTWGRGDQCVWLCTRKALNANFVVKSLGLLCWMGLDSVGCFGYCHVCINHKRFNYVCIEI